MPAKKPVTFKRKSGESIHITPGKPKSEKRLSAIKGAIVEFELDDPPYHATGTIVSKDTFNPRHQPKYKIIVIDSKKSNTYNLYRDEFEVVG